MNEQNIWCGYFSASDGTWSSDISVTIKVSDVNDESPTITKISSPSMVEETAVGTVLYGLYTASDPDVGDTVVYSHGGRCSCPWSGCCRCRCLDSKNELYVTLSNVSVISLSNKKLKNLFLLVKWRFQITITASDRNCLLRAFSLWKLIFTGRYFYRFFFTFQMYMAVQFGHTVDSVMQCLGTMASLTSQILMSHSRYAIIVLLILHLRTCIGDS